MLGDAFHDLLELQVDAQLHEAGIFQDGGRNPVLHAVSHLLLGLAIKKFSRTRVL